ncbi:hypothetical protein EDI_130940 [Entamoeba dispar SAW760]|uniref:Uncharacterized protein n=1 Tax=Entamoeba dispar (strain ATCC PRA-260 / SAW760) TaxID=370354 RepID=B0E9L0_ENTDS|nr:uncharacterized protein EDI_130940 [Entamoeba dispar SAW760]EDR28817.1 hypothetical protein EDI_130940 [Entamoeba dispar SAW760]|eukprot:EDR28817.1 hypothetical protein EDI_130940 [Entamoeba dispar SAW760]
MDIISTTDLFNIIQYLNNDDIISFSMSCKSIRSEIISQSLNLVKTRFKKEIKQIETIIKLLPNNFHFDFFVFMTYKYKMMDSQFVQLLQTNYSQFKYFIPLFTQNELFHKTIRQFYIEVTNKEEVNNTRNTFIDYVYSHAIHYRDINLVFFLLSHTSLIDSESLNRTIHLIKNIGMNIIFHYMKYHKVTSESQVIIIRVFPYIVSEPIPKLYVSELIQLLKSKKIIVRQETECCIKLLIQKHIIDTQSIPPLFRRIVINKDTQPLQKRVERKLETQKKVMQIKQPVSELRNTLHDLLKTIDN